MNSARAKLPEHGQSKQMRAKTKIPEHAHSKNPRTRSEQKSVHSARPQSLEQGQSKKISNRSRAKSSSFKAKVKILEQGQNRSHQTVPASKRRPETPVGLEQVSLNKAGAKILDQGQSKRSPDGARAKNPKWGQSKIPRPRLNYLTYLKKL